MLLTIIGIIPNVVSQPEHPWVHACMHDNYKKKNAEKSVKIKFW